MVSTTRDLARFADALFGGDLLRPATLEKMLTFVPSQYPSAEWGLGVLRAHTPDGQLVGHEGDGPGAVARMFRLPETDLTIVLLTNSGGTDDLVSALFADAMRAALATVTPND
jgi:D-alanyl-D-alanine carboxypeptidase